MCQLTSKPLNQVSLPSLAIPDLKKKSNKKRAVRLKFWEINSRYHCAALGTCLTLKELRQIGKKAGIEEIKTWTDYEMHVSFIHTLGDKSYVSTQVNKLLDKKFKSNVLHLSKTKTEQERIELWNKTASTGDIAGAFWALLTHPDTTENTLFQVYGRVHMLSHLSGAMARIDIREFYKLEQQNENLKYQINKNKEVSNKKTEKKDTDIKQLKEQLLTLKKENKHLQAAQQELDTLKNNPLVENLENTINQLNIELKNSQDSNQRVKNTEEKWKQHALKEQQLKQHFEQQLSNLSNENTSLEKSLTSLLSNQQEATDNCVSCPNSNPDLCGRCVLYIGGRSSQYSHFRKLVEQQNGTFIRHDGGREDGHHKLASIVSKADVVLCPLDCVSHNAMNAVKRHCQNKTKQLVFIPHASLSAFSKGLEEVLIN